MNEIATIEATPLPARQVDVAGSAFSGVGAFESAQRMAKLLCASNLVPTSYQNNLPDALVALEMAQRTGSSPLAVMQNMHVISGRPSWSSQFVIAALNSCGRFSPLRFRVEDIGEKSVAYTYWEGPKGHREKKTGNVTVTDRVCLAWAYDKQTKEVLEGPPVSIEMAVQEGWYTKSDSKWKTMPELMLRYRAAKFFGNLYAPDILMGMHTADEVDDVGADGFEQQRPAPAPAIAQPAAPAPVMPAPATPAPAAPAQQPEHPTVPLVDENGQIVKEYQRLGDYANALEKLIEDASAVEQLAAIWHANAGGVKALRSKGSSGEKRANEVQDKAADRRAQLTADPAPQQQAAEAPSEDPASQQLDDDGLDIPPYLDRRGEVQGEPSEPAGEAAPALAQPQQSTPPPTDDTRGDLF